MQRQKEKQPNSQHFISQLRELHANIDHDIGKMAALKAIYHQNQQKKFISTFISIMDRMSTELQRANELYHSIDKEIGQNQQCKYLSKELEYFQKECVQLKHTLSHKQQLLQQEKMREKALKKEQQQLQSKLYEQTYKEIKYKTMISALNNRGRLNAPQSQQSRSKSNKQRNNSTGMNDSVIYEEIYRKRPKSLRHMTSFKTEKRQNTTTYFQTKRSSNLFTAFKQN